ncbi:biopolymer transporter ExbD [Kiritimatiellota bacterium B12222]|nr:biopolymer transporter ExbD [Kiritimatiellota bacterium B12222]
MSMLKKTKAEAEVSLSPLIDAVFLLLIFFLVATMIKKEDKDIDIELPVSTSALKVKPDDRVVVIGIDATDGLYLDGTPTSLTELMLNLRELSATEPERRIRLDADRSTPFHRVVEVLDMLQFRGLFNVGIRTYDEHYN